MVNWNCWIPLMVVATVVVGCAAPVKPLGEQANISGAVTNDGKPIPADSKVTFVNSAKGATLGTTVDAAGKYTLTAADPKVGIPTGKYKIYILPPAPKAVQMSDQKNYEAMMKGGSNAPKPDTSESTAIPESVRMIEKTPLEFDVKAGPNEINIDLSKF